jgi:hypothetical protein
MRPATFPDWMLEGRLPRWPDAVIQLLRIMECVLLLLFC